MHGDENTCHVYFSLRDLVDITGLTYLADAISPHNDVRVVITLDLSLAATDYGCSPIFIHGGWGGGAGATKMLVCVGGNPSGALRG